jgi:hypothetical protein
MDLQIPKVLVDHCAVVNGLLIGRVVGETSTTMWGDHPVTFEVARLQGKKFGPAEDWLRTQISHLASVTAATLAGCIDAFTTAELIAERLNGRDGWSGVRGDLWKDVSFKHVSPPLERSTWMGGLTLDQVASREHQTEFCARLLHFEKHGVPQSFLEFLELDDFQIKNLERLCDFKTLCDSVGPTRWCDAFHLWTALCNELDYFLTTDQKFLRILRGNCADIRLLLPAVCPSELVDALHLPAVTLPIQEGEVIPIPFD